MGTAGHFHPCGQAGILYRAPKLVRERQIKKPMELNIAPFLGTLWLTQAQKTLPFFWYQDATWLSTEASMRLRLIFIVGVRKPFSIDQASLAMTNMRNFS
jgi:hypothetical protein